MFNSLPNELVQDIVKRVDKDDFLNFRLVCRTFQELLFDLFTRRYFESRYFETHLDNLVGISEHSTLRLAVKELVVSVHHCSLGDQGQLQENRGQLTLALNGFTNCKIVRLQGTEGLCDGVEPVQLAVQVILDAVVRSNCQLEKLDIALLEWALEPRNLVSIEPHSHQLASLKTLELGLNAKNFSVGCADDLVKFLNWLPQLEDFTLGFGYDTLKQPEFNKISELLHIRHLRRLRIVAVLGKKTDFTGIFLRHKDTLQEISLLAVQTTQESWKTLIYEIIIDLSKLKRLELFFASTPSIRDRTTTTIQRLDNAGPWKRVRP